MMFQPIWPVLVGAVLLMVASVIWARRERSNPSGRGRVTAVVRVVLAVAAVAIGLHPVGTVRVSEPVETTVDLVLVIDRTTSMGARDFAGDRPRMDGAAADLNGVVEAVAGAHLAVVVFDDDARLAVPFTTDATTVSTFLGAVGWRPAVKASGSDISVAAELTERVLRQAAADRPDHDRYLVYVGDGEQTAETPPSSFGPLSELLSGSMVLGYGTRSGGPMAASVEGNELVEIDGEVQTSRIDEEALQTIADQLGASYHHRVKAGDLPELVAPTSVSRTTELRPGTEIYWIIALAASGGLAVLLWMSATALRAAREEVADASR